MDSGCVKYTEGCYVQVFDKDGNLVEQRFQAGNSQYFDAQGDLLEDEDPRLEFYYPFAS